MGRELLISLGITILTAAALFLYFRNRFKLVEHKVNTIFQLVQSHSRGPPPSRFRQGPPQSMPEMVYAKPAISMEEKKDLIDVSDDDASSFTDSSAGSDSDSDIEFVKPVKLEKIDVELDIKTKKVEAPLDSEITSTLPQEINLDADVDSLSGSSFSSKSSVKHEPVQNTLFDYKKLTIPNLKKMAEERGFTNYKKLKKQGLVDLLSN